MGADYFDHTAVAKTPREAFRTAVESAQWEYGHGGYSGSIAEKSSFVMVELPARMTSRKFISLVNDADMYSNADREYEREHLAWLRRSGAKKTVITSFERQIKKSQRAHDRFWKTVPAHALDAVQTATEISNDKWGPAVCIELRGTEATAARKYSGKRGRVFKFFGYASS